MRSDAELSRQLGIDRSAVCRLKARGMPTDDLNAARAWREANLSPAHRKETNPARDWRRPPPAGAATTGAVKRLEQLLPAAESALRAGLLKNIEADVRAALRAVPPEARESIAMSLPLWDALCAPFIELVECEAGPVETVEMDTDEAASMGRIWYCFAAQEAFPAAWLDD